MTVFVNGIMYFKVKNAIHAVANVDDFGGSARLLAATTLRQGLTKCNLAIENLFKNQERKVIII